LSFAPACNLKVVYLENIERMTINAANALLKTFEEPLPNRLLVASVSSDDQLLDTIASRAFIIRFHPLSITETEHYITEHHAHVADDMKSFLTSFSLGRP
jgi:DNA polymerase III delta prime subunit